MIFPVLTRVESAGTTVGLLRRCHPFHPGGWATGAEDGAMKMPVACTLRKLKIVRTATQSLRLEAGEAVHAIYGMASISNGAGNWNGRR